MYRWILCIFAPQFLEIFFKSFTHMLNRYETVFILTPVLSEEQAKETVQKLKDVLVERGAKIINEENWGLKKLAYSIQKKSTGFYYLFEFEAEGDVIRPFETAYRRDERVMRFLTFKMENHAIAYAEKRKKKNKETATA